MIKHKTIYFLYSKTEFNKILSNYILILDIINYLSNLEPDNCSYMTTTEKHQYMFIRI